MKKGGTGTNTLETLYFQSFYCYQHDKLIWVNLAYNNQIFYIDRIHLYVSNRIRILYDSMINSESNSEMNIILQEERTGDVSDYWVAIAHLPNDHNAWPQNLSYNKLINKINYLLPFI